MTTAAIVVIFVALTTSCATIHGLNPIYPPATHPLYPERVKSLRPTLKWEPNGDPATTYEVVVYEAEFPAGTNFNYGIVGLVAGKDTVLYSTNLPGSMKVKAAPGAVVYKRSAISTPEHKIEEELKPNRGYFWSVRPQRSNEGGEAWSNYDYWWYWLVSWGDVNHRLYLFDTPSRADARE